MTTMLSPSARGASEVPPRSAATAGPLLVATDGMEASDAAFEAARLIAARSGADVHVLGALDPLPAPAAEQPVPDWLPDLIAARRDELVRRAMQQRATIVGPACDWRIEVDEGAPAVVIASAARDQKTSLIVLGLGRHTLVDRLFGDETALQVLRLSDVPVLAVPPSFNDLPHRAIIALDFSAPSLRAARAAVGLLRPDATVYLAHVVPRYALLTEAWEALQYGGAQTLDPEFTNVEQLLALPSTMLVERVMLHGNPPAELLRLAETSKADLIVTGSHGHGFLSRLILGSVATQVMRGASCAVLAVPAPMGDLVRDVTPTPRQSRLRTLRPDRSDWAEELEAFTKRNTSRDCLIEIDDPEFGAQAQAIDYPFLGAAYDRRDGRVDIMLGTGATSAHLTRSISDVTAIDLLSSGDGKDRLLRLGHGRGQTLLTFLQR